MFFHIAKDVYLAYFNDEIVVLDLPKDRYILLKKEMAEFLNQILTLEFQKINSSYMPIDLAIILPKDFDAKLSELRSMSIISTDDFNTQDSTDIRKNSTQAGPENLDWRMYFGDLNIEIPKRYILQAYILRIKVDLILKIRGFKGLIDFIKKSRNPKKSYKKTNPEEYNSLASIVNRACFYYFYRTKCLEWAATLTLLALKKGLQCNLVIGVQNMPFRAHAWGQVDNLVVADDKNLPKDLSVILSEPFSSNYSQKSTNF